MRIVDRGLIYDATAEPVERRVAAFTGLCLLQSGTVIASFHVGPTKQAPTSTIGLSRSEDGGAGWSPIQFDFSRQICGVPGSFEGGQIVEVRPGLLMMCTSWFDRSDPSRPLFNPVTEGILPTRQLRSFSTDEGCTWLPWEELPVGDLRACTVCGPILRWKDGTIAYAFESYKEYDDPRPHRHGAWLVVSRDGGQTFSSPRCVARHPEHRVYYWDQRLCALESPGEFVGLLWSHDLQLKQDLCVHMARGSIDHCENGPVKVRPTGITGQIAAPAILEDGRWLAFVVDRSGPNTLKLWVSEDEGKTWPEKKSLCVYNHDEQGDLSQGQHDIDYQQYWDDMLKWTFGHPCIQVLDNHTVLLSFYAGSPGSTSIHFVRVDCRQGK